MYVEVYDWNVMDKLKEGKEVFALDTKNNQVFDLLECSTKRILLLLEVAKNNNNRIIFYYWQEEGEKNEQV